MARRNSHPMNSGPLSESTPRRTIPTFQVSLASWWMNAAIASALTWPTIREQNAPGHASFPARSGHTDDRGPFDDVAPSGVDDVRRGHGGCLLSMVGPKERDSPPGPSYV